MGKTITFLLFLFTMSVSAQTVVHNISNRINTIQGQLAKVKELNAYSEQLSLETVQSLPVAITKVLSGQEYTILIQEAKLRPNGAVLTAAFVFVVPKTGDSIFFQAENIPLNSGGLPSDARMNLLQAPSIHLTDKISLTFVQGTYINWDCSGYKSMGLAGQVDFSQDLIVEDKADGSKGTEKVRATFNTSVTDWSDLTAELSISPFQPACFKGLGIGITSAVLDLSETQTPSSVVFPEGYSNDPLSRNLWEGVYLQNVMVRLPNAFKNKGGARTSFEGHHVLIDANGVSGSFTGMNVLTSKQGSMDGWGYSVDSIGITLAQNQIQSAGFRGTMAIPVKKKADKTDLRYMAVISSPDHYLFNVALGDKLEMEVWKAELALLPNSNVTVEYAEDRFLPRATLHGSISVDKDNVKLIGVAFEGLELATVDPYLKVQSFEVSSDYSQQNSGNQTQNFPIHLNKLGVVQQGELYGLKVELGVSLQEGNDAISAGGGVTLFGKVEGSATDFHSYTYDHTQFDRFYLDADLKAVMIKGYIDTYRENAIYGTGFKGSLEVSVLEKISVKGTAQFGRKATYRYWYVDAQAVLPTGIPIVPGAAIYGFSGGASRFMRRDVSAQKEFGDLSTPSQLEDLSMEPGTSLSGVRFIPDSTISLTLKAGVVFGTAPDAKLLNGKIELEMAFGSGGGIDRVSLYGDAAAMSEIGANPESAPVRVGMDLSFYVPEKTFSGVCDFSINTATTEGSGSLVIHFSPADWYVYLGTPQNRVSVSLKGFVTIQTYLCAGTKLPPYPDLPEKVRAIASSYNRDLNTELLTNAKGFAFGAYIEAGTGRRTASVFYYELTAGGGFDLMLAKLTGITCNNTGREPGWKGWYALGGVYAFIQGGVGITVKDMGDFSIFDAAFAAVIDGQFPSPSYMAGIVEGEYEILDGLVKGHCRFKFETGQKCELSGNALAGIEVIQSITPITSSSDVSVFTVPRASFNIPIGKTFEVRDMTSGRLRKFAARLQYIRVLDNGKILPGSYEWNDKATIAGLVPKEVLTPEKQLTAEVKIFFEESTSAGWKVYTVNGKKIEETKSVSFTTGKAPNFIPKENVVYSYPLEGQMHFLKSESSGGFIQLKIGQSYLLKVDERKWNQVLRMKSGIGEIVDGGFTYDSTNQKVVLSPPALNNTTIYELSLLNLPVAANQSVESNQSTQTTQQDNGATIRTNNLSGNVERLKEQSMLTYTFRTSRYNTFSEKLAEVRTNNPTLWVLPNGSTQTLMNLFSPELFDEYELKQVGNTQRLFQFTSGRDNVWFTENLDPLMYGKYPVDGKYYSTRDTSNIGMPPLKAVLVGQQNVRRLLPSETTTASPITGMATFVYDLSYYAGQDYRSLRAIAANQYPRSADLTKFLTTDFPNVRSGSYAIKAAYRLPDGTVTSEGSMTIINP